ncbi:uncharacterized protein Z520_02078 [Fonsecaea multimorphosa CBS 102226]|uniref:Uncharacterized protein n=1 Tax=Fonsecaea multimorphosa CBS 102226 TaxID=1442371 RepID=A0A0D2KF18_9EURO|nr:uncharacterized protein Z520_02078 [Fonsecaea multimorphosa CBS 102226]KIY01940.1 hypothetical protein Z520_02078 [Fonsecaea multimorphosa CBS 102226]OAL29622.1 hypothetical protein AYO22_02036 [Fonsecaea multimorphosa]
MSSLRNAVSRRPHKERAQPASREKWGLLEKHKDYSLRAQDYNLKKKKLSQLSQKARERNPDEFAFGMISQGRAGLGKHKSKQQTADDEGGNNKRPREGVPLSHDAVKLLKTQDAGYLRTVAAKGRREIERLTQEVGMDSVTLGTLKPATKKTFEDDEGVRTIRGKKRTSNGEVLQDQSSGGETDQPMQDAGIRATTVAQIPDDKDDPPKPKSKKALQAEQDALSRLRAERKRRKRLQDMRGAKLEALKTRQREIFAAADQLELQRAKMARTVGGVNKNGIRFKVRERKK